MNGVDKEHSASWSKDKEYYIRCQDYFGNYDVGCGKIIRMY
jgi:hypothetical protein